MQLTDEQKQTVARWISEGARLAEVQERLAAEYEIRLTYMEARFLVDDLSLVPHEKEQPKKPEEETPAEAAPEEEAATPGGVNVTLDQIVRPGAMVSGKVTFTDGITAEWYLDQTGRFGLVPPEEGYRPSKEDLAEFQVALERELSRKGL